MSAYVLVKIEVLDQGRYETYKQLAPSSIAVYGGRYLARGGLALVFVQLLRKPRHRWHCAAA